MYKLVYLTCSGHEQAQKIAETLVKEKLCACVNYFPINSVYYWKEQLVKDQEIGMMLKTTAPMVEKIIERIKELHSYEVPAIFSLNMEKGNPDFLKWIKDSVQ